MASAISSQRAASTQVIGTGLWQFAIVEKPFWWDPSEWDELPGSSLLLEVHREPMELEVGIGMVCAYNFTSLQHPGLNWAVLVPYDLQLKAGLWCTQFCTHLSE